ncbi:hypothetical protein HS7_20950 [Sulfolobales archaeon HS-7]|nr:hypothetical protein HS7_20950 [Sulfolobales archaeon HS-7]
MDINIDDLKKFLENKVNELRKETEYYEYLLSLVESGELSRVRSNRASIDSIKSVTNEVIAEVYFSPPTLRIVAKRPIHVTQAQLGVINRILQEEKNQSGIEYEVSSDREYIKEILINNINEQIVYTKIKAEMQTLLERIYS